MTRLLVLGILDTHPMSGYDIKQTLEMTDAQRWGGVLIGSIYHALKKLEQENYIKISSIEKTGNRQKAIYAITEVGKKHLQDLIIEGLQTSSVIYPSNIYSALSFYEKSSIEECKKALINQQKTLEGEFISVQKGFEAKSLAMENKIPPMVMLVMEHMFSIIKQQQNFVGKALEILEMEK